MTIKRFDFGTERRGTIGMPGIVGKVDGRYVLYEDYLALKAAQQRGEPTPSEAVYAFAAWLTTRKHAVTLGSTQDAAIVAELVSLFVASQGWESPRDDYIDHLRAYPSEAPQLTAPAQEPCDDLKGLCDRAYCQYIESLRTPECLGWEHKVKTGKFGEKELKAHNKASEHLGRHRAFSEAIALLARYGQPTTPKGWRLVPAEPDTALLVSTATCLYHGFGLLDEGRQDSTLHDMRKLHEEVLGKGYYSPENRERYLSMLAAAPKFGAEQ